MRRATVRGPSIKPSAVNSFSLIARYGAIAAAVAVLAITLLGPLLTSLIDDWSRRDVESRSALVFNSINGPLSEMLTNGEGEQIKALFARVAADPRIVAVGVCRGASTPQYATPLMPPAISCEKIARTESRASRRSPSTAAAC